MPKYAIILENKVENIIFADTVETAESLFPTAICIEYTDEQPLHIEDTVDDKKIEVFAKEKTKRETAKIKKEQDEAKAQEIARVKAIEAENERLRNLEAERLAAEQATKIQPVTGIFVKVEPN